MQECRPLPPLVEAAAPHAGPAEDLVEDPALPTPAYPPYSVAVSMRVWALPAKALLPQSLWLAQESLFRLLAADGKRPRRRRSYPEALPCEPTPAPEEGSPI